MNRFLLTLAFIMLIPTTVCDAQDMEQTPKTFRWQFIQGEKYHVLISRCIVRDIKYGSAHFQETTQTIIDALYCIESIDANGTAQITLSYQRGRLKVQSPNENIDIDTSSSGDQLPGPAAAWSKTIKEIISKLKFRFSVDNRGQILSVNANNAGIKPSDETVPDISERVAGKEIRRTLSQMFPVFPEKPLAIGDTWDNSLEANLPGMSDFKRADVKYRYAGPAFYKNASLEKITTKAILKGEDTPPEVRANVVSKENTGTIYFDNKAGLLVELSNSQKMLREFENNGQTIQEQRIVTSKVEINPVTSKEK